MQDLTLDSVRTKFLDFLARHDHAVIPSAPLVPNNDPTTLFTGSGMQPLVPYLLGEPHPKGQRLANSQKCFRAVDIEDVGDNRHSTYFEMLGNWSLGDYFKDEQIRWVFTFFTQEVGLDPKNLYVSVFAGAPELDIPRDDESVALWQEMFSSVGIEAKTVEHPDSEGLGDGRIFFYKFKNWWSRSGDPAAMPAGEPGGPDSEVFYDFGEKHGFHEASEWKDQPCHINCDCGRFLEIGNSVFMQYQKQEDGSFSELPNKNVDFGGGLMRIAAAAAHNPDVFETDGFRNLIEKIEQLSGKSYHDESVQRSFRVIADHVRAAVMLAADGVYPSNKEQGYFVRRLLRRAIRFGKMIAIDDAFLGELVPVVVAQYQNHYPEVAANQDRITQSFMTEEKKFERALQKGMREIEKVDQLTGETAFYLYETYGFPFELTQEIAEERGSSISRESFDQAREQHAAESRQGSAQKFKGGLADQSEATVKYHTATHLLHAALRKLLGATVQQKGSNITAERLRFDFSFDRALGEDEKAAVQAQINEWIEADLPVTMKMMNKQEALESGAIAFFVEKYPDEVSVYTVGSDDSWVSKEFCGGPHVEHTGVLGPIEITKEQSAGAGIRRIYIEFKE